MKVPAYPKGNRHGFTLIELTVIIIVVISLIAVFFFSGQAYTKESNRASCLTAQDRIKKNVISYGLLFQPLREGVEYYDNNVLQANFGSCPTCPETGGEYSVQWSEEDNDVLITCLDRDGVHVHR